MEPPSVSASPTPAAADPDWAGAESDVFVDTDRGRLVQGPVRSALEWGAVVVGALLAALLIKAFLFQAFYIPSESMSPTLEQGDRVMVNKLSYTLGDVERGDIVVFHKPEGAADAAEDDFIKRVIGIPGDVVEAVDGAVWLNDRPLNEPYLAAGTVTENLSRVEVPADEVLVLGDNRQHSFDGRFFGTIPIDSIVGEAFIRVWPVGRLGGL